MRRSLLAAATLTVGVAWAGGAYAESRSHDTNALKPPKLLKVTPTVHVCHPGVKGSRLDALN